MNLGPKNEDYYNVVIIRNVKLASPLQWPQRTAKYAASCLKFREFFEWNDLVEGDIEEFQRFVNLPELILNKDIYDVVTDAERDMKRSRGYLEEENGNCLISGSLSMYIVTKPTEICIMFATENVKSKKLLLSLYG